MILIVFERERGREGGEGGEKLVDEALECIMPIICSIISIRQFAQDPVQLAHSLTHTLLFSVQTHH